MNPTPFPNLDLPFVDPSTGKINKGWYQLLASMYLLLGGSTPVSTPDLGVMAGLMDENFSATIEVENSLDALHRALVMDDALTARMAELKNNLDAIANGSIDGQSALIAETRKALAELQMVLNLMQEGYARLAEIDKRLADIEVGNMFHAEPNGNNLTGTTTTNAPAAGSANALPATPAGYLTVDINGKIQQLPYY